tara:strand:- start:455 stop:580 length:126 start_codon:yes stop_codon:yes gene_type:complete
MDEIGRQRNIQVKLFLIITLPAPQARQQFANMVWPSQTKSG